MEKENKKCAFCDSGVIANQKIYEGKLVYVLYNLKKTNRGRCQVIPKRHVSTIGELTTFELEEIMKTVQLVAGKLNKYLKPSGINYGFNEGIKAGQVEEHFHFHILPRYDRDELSEFHLFHSDPKIKANWTTEEVGALAMEFSSLFKKE